MRCMIKPLLVYGLTILASVGVGMAQEVEQAQPARAESVLNETLGEPAASVAPLSSEGAASDTLDQTGMEGSASRPPRPAAGSGGIVTRLRWTKLPLKVTLPVGREVAVTFPAAAGWYDVRMPSGLAGTLQVDTIDSTTLLRASTPFEEARLQVASHDGGAFYLIDVRAVDDADVGDYEVIDPSLLTPIGGSAEGPALTDGFEGDVDAAPEITLTRFMSIQFYGLQRLAPTAPGIHRYSVTLPATLPLIRNANVEAKPIAAWRYGDVHGLAIELRNLGREDYQLDPRMFRGAWRMATPQHGYLAGRGSQAAKQRGADRTMVYLIAGMPIDRAASEMLNLIGRTP